MNISKLLLLLNGKTAEDFPEVTAKATFRLGRGETVSDNLTFRMNVTAPIGSKLTVNYGDCRTQSDHSVLYPDQTYESDGLPIEISASLYLSGLRERSEADDEPLILIQLLIVEHSSERRPMGQERVAQRDHLQPADLQPETSVRTGASSRTSLHSTCTAVTCAPSAKAASQSLWRGFRCQRTS